MNNLKMMKRPAARSLCEPREHQNPCLTAAPHYVSTRLATYSCPYHDEKGSTCGAALSYLLVDTARMTRFCRSEDHDDCPLFLGKILRHRG